MQAKGVARRRWSTQKNLGISRPDEWWEGFEAIREAMRAQSEAMEWMRIVAGELRAYREGEVGWVVDRDASFRLPDGTQIPFRNSVVFRREDGE